MPLSCQSIAASLFMASLFLVPISGQSFIGPHSSGAFGLNLYEAQAGASWSKLKALGAQRQTEAGSDFRRVTSDSKGRPIRVIEPDERGNPAYVTDISYDSNGRVSQITQHGGKGDIPRTRTFTYDGQSHVLSASSPEAGKVTYTYDASGNLSTKTDAMSQTTTYTWDTNRRLIRKSYTDSRQDTVFEYAKGSPIHASYLMGSSGESARREYTYDNTGRLRSIVVHAAESGNVCTVGYAYDLAGRVTSIVYPDGRVITKRWTKKGLLYSVGDGSILFFSHPTYSLPSGHMTKALLGERAVSQREYDGHNRLVRLTVTKEGDKLVDQSFAYTKNGSLSQFTDSIQPRMSSVYGYDVLNRVKSAVGEEPQSFVYDAFGNAASLQDGIADYTFDENNRIHSNAGITYDEDGRITFDGLHRYTYNGDGLIRSVDDGKYLYEYDAEGNRIQKRSSSGSEDFVWVDGQLLAERSTDGVWTDYVYVEGERFASIRNAAQKNKPGQVTYFVNSPLGVHRTAISQTGEILVSGHFGPFGNPVASAQSAHASSISFSDEVHDPETGLDNYQYRSYNPKLRRWMSPDPSSLHYSLLSNPQTFNLYSYVTNDPLKYIDLHGLSESGPCVSQSDPDDGSDDEDSGEPGCGEGGSGGGSGTFGNGGTGDGSDGDGSNGNVNGDGCAVDACVTTDPIRR